MTYRPARAALLVALALVPSACQRPAVVRVTGGEEHVGAFVTPYAYAAYARGAVAESEGRLDAAAQAYAEALDEGDDALVHARLGAVLCAQGRVAAAREQLARGNQADPRAAVVFRERARCALRSRAYDEAVEASQHAIELDPEDRESLSVRAEALARAGRERDAAALRDERAAREGHVAEAGARTIAATAVRPGADLAPALREDRGELAKVDDALARGDLDDASGRASRLRLSRSDLAARALAFGHVAFARDLARRVAAADPHDASARLVAAAGADLAGDGADVSRVLAGDGGGAPSDLARLLFAEALARRDGATAKTSFESGLLAETRTDPLAERVRLRLRAAVGLDQVRTTRDRPAGE